MLLVVNSATKFLLDVRNGFLVALSTTNTFVMVPIKLHG